MSGRANLLLGGAGLIGRALAARLERAGERVAIYDLRDGFDLGRRDPPDPEPGAFVWFLAWDTGGARYIYDPALQSGILARNTALADRVFGWLERTGAPFLFTTTQLAGAPHAYGRTKALGEVQTRRLGGRIARLWNVYGAEAPEVKRHVIPDLIARAARTGVVHLASSGRERRQFIHAGDCADALVMQRDAGVAEADVTSGRWIAVREVGERLARILDLRFEAGDTDGPEHIVEPARMLPGWTPGIGLDDGLARVVEAMRARGWCDPPAPA